MSVCGLWRRGAENPTSDFCIQDVRLLWAPLKVYSKSTLGVRGRSHLSREVVWEKRCDLGIRWGARSVEGAVVLAGRSRSVIVLPQCPPSALKRPGLKVRNRFASQPPHCPALGQALQKTVPGSRFISSQRHFLLPCQGERPRRSCCSAGLRLLPEPYSGLGWGYSRNLKPGDAVSLQASESGVEGWAGIGIVFGQRNSRNVSLENHEHYF